MKLISILSATAVTVVLYLLVFERDTLLGLAGIAAPPAAEATADVAAAAPAADPQPATDAAPAPVSVIAMQSAAREIDSAVILRGETQAMREVEVRAETTGQVVSPPLRKGAFVQAGDVLCRLDEGTRPATLAENEARLAEAMTRGPEAQSRVLEAQARLAEARLNETAAARLNQDGFASDTRVAGARATLSSAEAAVASAEAGLSAALAGVQAAEAGVAAARKELTRTVMAAPFAGLLESDTAELGSLLQAGALCATVIQLDPIKIVGFVPETEVARVEVGARAGARLVTGQEVIGRVTFLSRSADPQTRTFRTEIEVPNGDLSIRDGQTADILIAAEGANAHLLPASALTLNDDGALGVRVVSSEGTAAFMAVNLIRDSADGVWVTGLGDSADIIVVGQEYVTDGVPVTATFRESMK